MHVLSSVSSVLLLHFVWQLESTRESTTLRQGWPVAMLIDISGLSVIGIYPCCYVFRWDIPWWLIPMHVSIAFLQCWRKWKQTRGSCPSAQPNQLLFASRNVSYTEFGESSFITFLRVILLPETNEPKPKRILLVRGNSWLHADAIVVCMKDWLSADCPHARLLSVEYETALSEWKPQCPYELQRYIYVMLKTEYSCSWESISELQSVTCHMGSHSVTCHPTQVNAPCHNPSQPSLYLIYLPRMDERLSWPR